MVDLTALLQIDATIIAGALILLTITSFVGTRPHEPIGIIIKNKGVAFTPHQVASGTIAIFAISAFCVLIDYQIFAYLSAGIGFVWLVVCSLVIAGKEQFDHFKSNIRKKED